MQNLRACFLLTALALTACGQKAIETAVQGSRYSAWVVEEVEVDSVWAANRVAFALQTVGEQQFVAYYNKERMMTVASRSLGSATWQKKVLPNKLRWDSHNYVTLGVDEAGYLHVSGNMHVNPLAYFRSTRPLDINSLEEVNTMVGKQEDRVTYPKFFTGKDGRLFFSYRAGTSGNGDILVNRYDAEAGKWERYLPTALFDGSKGEEKRSAYHRFLRDEAGNFHYVWLWRWTPLVETSHQLCYATSPDLIHWQNAAGEAVSLPFEPDNQKLIVDGTPTQGGLHNSRFQIILTPANKPLIGYVKYDSKGNTQLYVARFRKGGWLSSQISNWDFRWQFVGGGDQMTMGANFDLEGFSEEGILRISWETEKAEAGNFTVNPNTLERLPTEVEVKPRYPAVVYQKQSPDPQMGVRLESDHGNAAEPGTSYVLKWETMPQSHGRHAPKIIPAGPLSPLRLLKIQVANKFHSGPSSL